MKRRGFLKTAVASAASLSTTPLLRGIPIETDLVKCGNLQAILGADGNVVRLRSGSAESQRLWLEHTPTLMVRDEVSDVSDCLAEGRIKARGVATIRITKHTTASMVVARK